MDTRERVLQDPKMAIELMSENMLSGSGRDTKFKAWRLGTAHDWTVVLTVSDKVSGDEAGCVTCDMKMSIKVPRTFTREEIIAKVMKAYCELYKLIPLGVIEEPKPKEEVVEPKPTVTGYGFAAFNASATSVNYKVGSSTGTWI